MSLINFFSGRRTDERGATAIMVALSATVMLGAGALAVDVGQVFAARAELQQAVDKAAVAAASQLDGSSVCTSTARSQAQKLLAANWPRTAGNKLTAASIPLDGTPAGGTIACTKWTVKLTAPTARVDYGLAKAVTSASGVDVPAVATAGVFSPGNTKAMPAYTTGSSTCTYGSHVLFHGPEGLIGSLGLDDPLCALGMGNFGSLKLPRRIDTTNENTELAINIARGPDFTLAKHPIQTYTTCGSGSSDVVSKKGALQNGTNCIDTLRGNRANAAEDGLIQGVTEAGTSYPGLLDAPTSDQCKTGLISGIVPGLSGRSDLSIDGHRVNNDRLECYLKVNLDLNVLGEGYAGPVVLDPKVLDSPRFVWVPVISALPPCLLELVCEFDNDSVTHGDGFYKVLTFRPGFIQGPLGVFDTKKCELLTGQCAYNGLLTDKNDSLLAVRIFLFSDRALPESIKFDTTREYLGVGPRVIRLTD